MQCVYCEVQIETFLYVTQINYTFQSAHYITAGTNPYPFKCSYLLTENGKICRLRITPSTSPVNVPQDTNTCIYSATTFKKGEVFQKIMKPLIMCHQLTYTPVIMNSKHWSGHTFWDGVYTDRWVHFKLITREGGGGHCRHKNRN
jgi:hypothetical protein